VIRSAGAFLSGIVLMGALAGELSAQLVPDSVLAGNDGLTWKATAPESWSLDQETSVLLTLGNRSENEVLLDSAVLNLPPELVCGDRPARVPAAFSRGDLPPGESLELRFRLPAGAAWCPGGLKLGKSETIAQIWYFHPSEMDRADSKSLVLRWSAPLPVVMVGAAVGVLAAYTLLVLAKRTGADDAPSRLGPMWAEIGFGLLISCLLIALIRLVDPVTLLAVIGAPGLLGTLVKAFVAGTIGHGLLLGLLYQVAGQELIGLIQRRKKVSTAAVQPAVATGQP
jgi:hypothetical protein